MAPRFHKSEPTSSDEGDNWLLSQMNNYGSESPAAQGNMEDPIDVSTTPERLIESINVAESVVSDSVEADEAYRKAMFKKAILTELEASSEQQPRSLAGMLNHSQEVLLEKLWEKELEIERMKLTSTGRQPHDNATLRAVDVVYDHVKKYVKEFNRANKSIDDRRVETFEALRREAEWVRERKKTECEFLEQELDGAKGMFRNPDVFCEAQWTFASGEHVAELVRKRDRPDEDLSPIQPFTLSKRARQAYDGTLN